MERDNAINNIQLKLDDQDMTEWDKNVIIEGLKGESKEEIATELNDLLVLDPQLLPSDLQTTYKLMPKSDNIEPSKVKTKVIFKEKTTKMEVMKAKPNLRGKPVWINDDLTTYRSGVAFRAREAMRAGKIEKTWTHDGKIFAKKFGIERPIKIITNKDIPV